MRAYVRGDLLPLKFASTLSKAGLRKWWLTDNQGHPIGKRYNRKSEIVLSQPDSDYVIISGKVGKPKKYNSEKERQSAVDKKRATNLDRKLYRAKWMRDDRARKASSKTEEK